MTWEGVVSYVGQPVSLLAVWLLVLPAYATLLWALWPEKPAEQPQDEPETPEPTQEPETPAEPLTDVIPAQGRHRAPRRR